MTFSNEICEEVVKTLRHDDPDLLADKPELIAAFCLYARYGITACTMKSITWGQIDLREGELKFKRKMADDLVYVLQDPEWDCLDRMHSGQDPADRVFSDELIELVRSRHCAWRSGVKVFAEDMALSADVDLMRTEGSGASVSYRAIERGGVSSW